MHASMPQPVIQPGPELCEWRRLTAALEMCAHCAALRMLLLLALPHAPACFEVGMRMANGMLGVAG